MEFRKFITKKFIIIYGVVFAAGFAIGVVGMYLMDISGLVY